MQWTPETISTAFEGIRLLIYCGVLVSGGVIAIFKKIDKIEKTILDDVNKKHEENRIRVDALQKLVIRHDTILSPEFNGHYTHRHVSS